MGIRIIRKEHEMFPPNFSSHETYAKHRNPEEITRIEKQNRDLAARHYKYGDPINSKSKAQKPAEPVISLPVRGARHAFPLAHFFSHFFSFFTHRP
jgi:hypothetical protein